MSRCLKTRGNFEVGEVSSRKKSSTRIGETLMFGSILFEKQHGTHENPSQFCMGSDKRPLHEDCELWGGTFMETTTLLRSGNLDVFNARPLAWESRILATRLSYAFPLTFVALPLAFGAPVIFARLNRASFMS